MMYKVGSLFGVELYECEYLPKKFKYFQSRYPKSKKKRIRNKFAKKYGKYIEIHNDNIYLLKRDFLKLDFKPYLVTDFGAAENSYLTFWHGIDSLTGAKF